MTSILILTFTPAIIGAIIYGAASLISAYVQYRTERHTCSAQGCTCPTCPAYNAWL